VARILKFDGWHPCVVQNITDVGHMSENFEDKLLEEAAIEKRSPIEIARDYEERFFKDLTHLNIAHADHSPRASESISLMQEMILTLIENEFAYVGADNSVYFSAEKFDSYGAISGNRLDALKPGHRYDYVDDGEKRFHADWALWKSAGDRDEMVWDSPWGKGFPGWHIECSAMSMKYLDRRVDLHIGGIDLRFPHHENERAQSNSVAHREVVSHWLHGEHLLFEGKKMSKSSGNVLLVSDVIEKGFDPLALRLTFLESKYRNQLDLSWDAIRAADKTIKRWRLRVSEWGTPAIGVDIEDFLILIRNDFDFPRALVKLRALEKDTSVDASIKAAIFLTLDQILGLGLNSAK
jgi:cysteinyl-tRNA synthetase